MYGGESTVSTHSARSAPHCNSYPRDFSAKNTNVHTANLRNELLEDRITANSLTANYKIGVHAPSSECGFLSCKAVTSPHLLICAPPPTLAPHLRSSPSSTTSFTPGLFVLCISSVTSLATIYWAGFVVSWNDAVPVRYYPSVNGHLAPGDMGLDSRTPGREIHNSCYLQRLLLIFGTWLTDC